MNYWKCRSYFFLDFSLVNFEKKRIMHLITKHKFLWSQLQNVCKILERLVSWVDDFKSISTHKRRPLMGAECVYTNNFEPCQHVSFTPTHSVEKPVFWLWKMFWSEKQILLNDISWTSLWTVWCQGMWLDALLYIPYSCIMYWNEMSTVACLSSHLVQPAVLVSQAVTQSHHSSVSQPMKVKSLEPSC